MPLTSEDMLVYGMLRDARVLQPVAAHELDERQGVILVSCGDGDHFTDIFTNHQRINVVHREASRIHSLSLNGGALLIAEGSPLNGEFRKDLILINDIQVARDLKDIHTVALYVHRPCGAAQMAGLDFLTTIDLLMNAKARLKVELSNTPPLKLACFLHIAFADGSKKTYFVSREHWLVWQKTPRAIRFGNQAIGASIT